MTALQVFVLMMLSISAALAQQTPPGEGKASPKPTLVPSENVRPKQPPLGAGDAVTKPLVKPRAIIRRLPKW